MKPFLRKLALIYITIYSSTLFTSNVFAVNITVSEAFDISVSGYTFQITTSSNALDQLVINDAGTSFTLTTALADGVVEVFSTSKVDIGGANNSLNDGLDYCNDSGSKLKIRAYADRATYVTITPPTTGNVYCQAGSVVGGTSGSGANSASAGGQSLPGQLSGDSTTQNQANTTGQTGTPSAPVSTPSEQQKSYDQNDFSDLPSMTGAEQAMVKSLVAKMLAAKTFMMPLSLKFMPKALVKWSTAVRYLTYTAGTNCGSARAYPGYFHCAKVAKAAGLTNYDSFDLNNLTNNLTRFEFYSAVLKAVKLPVGTNLSGDDLAATCSDSADTFSVLGKRTEAGKLTGAEKAKIANVFAAARTYGIAAKFGKDACRLHVAFTRVELVKLVTKVLAAKAKVGK